MSRSLAGLTIPEKPGFAGACSYVQQHLVEDNRPSLPALKDVDALLNTPRIEIGAPATRVLLAPGALGEIRHRLRCAADRAVSAEEDTLP